MEAFKFIFDDDNLKDIKVICSGGDEMSETLKTFCIDTIPEELEPEVMSTEDGFLISSEEHGEEVLTHLFKYVYLITRLAIIFKDDLGKTNVEDLDFSLLRPDIEKVESMDYHELAKLLEELDHVEEDKE